MDKSLDSVVVSSRIRLARNFENIPFPSKISQDEAFSVVMKKTYDSIQKLGDYKIYTMETLPSLSRQVLFEKHLISKNLIEEPNFSAVVLSADEKISVMINEEDHIRLQCILDGFNLDEAYKQINVVDDAILKDNNIAYTTELGFLTACPTNLGTGMRASVMLFLPALSMLGKIDELVDVVHKFGLTVRGATGEGSAADGFLFQISNQVSLGLSEEKIIEKVKNTVLKICDIELNARSELMLRDPELITDECMRAYGLLSCAYKMTSKEFNTLFAKVKLGVCLEILKCKDKELLKSIEKIVQPATLLEVSQKELDGDERDVFRAEYLRKTLKGCIIL